MKLIGLAGAGVAIAAVAGCPSHVQSSLSGPSRSELSSLWTGAAGQETLLMCTTQAMQVIDAVKPQVVAPPPVSAQDFDSLSPEEQYNQLSPVNRTRVTFQYEQGSFYPSLKISVSDIHALADIKRMFDGSSSARISFNLNVVPEEPTLNRVRDDFTYEVAKNVADCLIGSASLPSYKAATDYFQGSSNTVRYSFRFDPSN
jgi:hypothetical protein